MPRIPPPPPVRPPAPVRPPVRIPPPPPDRPPSTYTIIEPSQCSGLTETSRQQCIACGLHRGLWTNNICSIPSELVQMLVGMGIKSKTAMYYIIKAGESTTYPEITYQVAAERWIDSKKMLVEIHNRAQKIQNVELKNTFFAFHAMYALRFGALAWEKKQPDATVVECPYGTDSPNFIIALVKTNRCKCDCYSLYITAAAEEFDMHLISLCESPGHVRTVIMSSTRSEYRTDTIVFGIKTTVFDVSITPLKTSYEIRKVYAAIDSGFEENMFIDIDTMNDNVKKEIGGILLLTPDQMKRRVGWKRLVGDGDAQCTTDPCFHISQWNTILSIFRGFIQGKGFNDRFDRFIDILSAIWKFDFSSIAKYAKMNGGAWTQDVYQKALDSIRETIDEYANPPMGHPDYDARVENYPTPKQARTLYFSCMI